MNVKLKIRGFTLVELMVVLGIMTILMTLAVPSFDNLMRGDAVARTTRSLTTAIAQARAKAAATRRYVALLLPDGSSNQVDQDNRPYGPPMRSYRLCYVLKDGDNFVFDDWGPDSNWLELADKAVVAQVFCADKFNEDNSGGRDISVKHNESSYFDGWDRNGNSGLLYIGVTDNSVDNYYGSSNGRGEVGALVFSPTGQLANGEAYIVVAEGSVRTDPDNERTKTFLFRNRDEEGYPMNCREIMINKFTGKTKVLADEY